MPLPPDKASVALMASRVATCLHADKTIEGAQLAADWAKELTGLTIEVADKSQAEQVLTLLLHWLLENDGYEDAANLLWGKDLFNHEPESAQRVWRAFEEHNFILLMGAASMSKSYSMGVRLMLEWIRDPEYTNIKVLGPSEQHLEDNLFTHLVSLHRSSSIPLPGEIGKLFIGIDARARKGAITGVVIPLGKKAAGRIQGSKRVNRKVPHPKFGNLSRMFIFLDEIANIPAGVWKDIDNVVASSQGDNGLKIIGAFNPSDQHDEVGKRVEPPKGWGEFDPDVDIDWISTRDWRVVRLDAQRCENVVTGTVKYPGLQTKSGFEKLIKNAGGVDSPGYWSMGRGCFPPTGQPMSIIPPGLLAKVKAEVIWYEKPTPVGAVDMALQGGDVAVFCKGSFGLATGIKYAATLEHPSGQIVNFKDGKGRTALKQILLAEAMLKLPRGDTVATTEEVKRVARGFGIRPDCLCVDRTGNGQGVFDMLRNSFGEIIGVNYSESSSETKVMAEDMDTAYELYDRVYTELWFAARGFIEFGYALMAPGFDTEDLIPQLTGRRYKMSGRRRRVETKQDFQLRTNGKSPDEADSYTLLIHCVRRAFSFIPGMTLENSTEASGHSDGEDGDEVRVDVTNRYDDI